MEKKKKKATNENENSLSTCVIRRRNERLFSDHDVKRVHVLWNGILCFAEVTRAEGMEIRLNSFYRFFVCSMLLSVTSKALNRVAEMAFHFVYILFLSSHAKIINIAMAKWKRNCFDLKAFPRELEILKWTSLSELERWRSSSIRAEWMHLWSSNRAIARMKNNLVISLFIYYWNVSTYRSRRPIYRSIEQHTSWMRINLWFPNRFNIILAEEILFFCFNYNYESHLIHEND